MHRQQQFDPWNTSPSYKRVQFVKSDVKYDYDKRSMFVRVRRSKKGMNLNIPEQFYTTPTDHRVIRATPILPTGGCTDEEYVGHNRHGYRDRGYSTNGKAYYKNGRNYMEYEEELDNMYFPNVPNTGRGRMYYKNNIHYSPSLTINIDPGSINRPYAGCQQKMSFSTISINPSAPSQEVQFTTQNVIPLGIMCCKDKKDCQYHLPDEPKRSNVQKNVNANDERYVYVTAPPKISPLKSCWRWLSCKKKRAKGEVYLPTGLTQIDTSVETDGATTHAKDTKDITFMKLADQRKYELQRNISRLSTITESDTTVYRQSSEDFKVIQDPGPEKKRIEKVRPHNHETRPLHLQRESFMSDKYAFSNYDQQNLYRWVCEPTGRKMQNGESRSHYICYKE